MSLVHAGLKHLGELHLLVLLVLALVLRHVMMMKRLLLLLNNLMMLDGDGSHSRTSNAIL
jgi:hypothetical protein